MAKKTRTTRKPTAPVKFYRRIVLGFVVLIGVLIVLAVYFFLSRAEIRITIAKEPVSADFLVDLKEQVTENPSGPAVAVPGVATIQGQLAETTVSGTKEYPATGKKTEQGEVGGAVTIFNNYSKDQTLIATTRLLSSEGILYRLKNRVTVPAGGKVENVEVYADQPSDAASNLGPTKFTIPGLWEGLQDKIYAQSFTAMHGGSQEVTYVTEDDLNNAYDDLTKSLSQEVLDGMKTKMTAAGEVFGKVVIKSINEKHSSLAAGATGDNFTVTLKLDVVGVAFYRRDLEAVALDQLKAKVPEGKDLLNVDYNDMTFLVEKYDIAGGEANLMVHLTGEMALKSDSPIFDKDKFVGLSKDKVIQYLSLYPEVQKITIKLFPFWVKQVPDTKSSVNIIVQTE